MPEISPSILEHLAQFHFLRPLWLFSIPVAVLLLIFFWRKKSSTLNWGKAIAQPLLKYLVDPDFHRISSPQRWPWLALFFAWLITAIALAGPAWQKLPQPVHERQDALAIVLDLSLSMYSQDIKPSRLVRARYKVLDILKARKEGLSALIAYSRDAHIASPLTDDTNTVANLVPALSPEMMPALGSNPAAGIKAAIELFKNTGLNEGRIILISDGISDKDSKTITKLLDDEAYELSIMAVATTAGAPIPLSQGFVKDNSGTIVTPQLDRVPFQQLAAKVNGRYIESSIDNSDIDFLLPSITKDLNTATRETERQFDQWQDQGAYLALLIIPFALLGFRRGWLLALPLFFMANPQTSYALDWQDLWQTPNQQAMQLLQQGEPERAADKFEDPDWQATANYKAEKFAEAAKRYAAKSQQNTNATATDFYNHGNALAKLGKYDEAIQQYEQALKIKPDFEDADFNKKLIEQVKQQQQDQPQNNDEQQDQQNKDEQNQQNNDEQKNDQQDQQDQQDNNEQENNEQENQDQSKQNEQDSQKDKKDDQQQADQDNKENSETDKEKEQANQDREQQPEPADQDKEQEAKEQELQAMKEAAEKEADKQEKASEQWLRQIPDDPSGLLRRKFDYEYRQRQAEQKSDNEDQPLW